MAKLYATGAALAVVLILPQTEPSVRSKGSEVRLGFLIKEAEG